MKTVKKSEVKNLKEFKQLIRKYKSITLEKLEKEWKRDGFETLNKITGFGCDNACVLCKGRWCGYCIYSIMELNKESLPCVKTPYYIKIVYAKTPKQLYNAIQGRIKFMEKLLTKIK